MLLHPILLAMVLHGVSSYYFYNTRTHYVLTLPSLANVPRGYKLIPAPSQRRSFRQDGRAHSGQCIDPGFFCNKPYDNSTTYQFRCTRDGQCPKFHKCCTHRCFVHQICMKSETQQKITIKHTQMSNLQKEGTCEKWSYNCLRPYPYSVTSVFKCEYDRQCPKSYKCCEQTCFVHKICSRAIIRNDSYVEELRRKVTERTETTENKKTTEVELTPTPENTETETETTEEVDTTENEKTTEVELTQTPENTDTDTENTEEIDTTENEKTTEVELSQTSENIETESNTSEDETSVTDVTESTEEFNEEMTEAVDITENIVYSTSETATESTDSESSTASDFSESITEETSETTNEEDGTNSEDEITESSTESTSGDNVSITTELEYSTEITTEAQDESDNITLPKSVIRRSTPDSNSIIPEYADYYYYYDNENETAYDIES